MQFMATWHWATSDIKIQIKLGLFNLRFATLFPSSSKRFVGPNEQIIRCGIDYSEEEKRMQQERFTIEIVKTQTVKRFYKFPSRRTTFLLTPLVQVKSVVEFNPCTHSKRPLLLHTRKTLQQFTSFEIRRIFRALVGGVLSRTENT